MRPFQASERRGTQLRPTPGCAQQTFERRELDMTTIVRPDVTGALSVQSAALIAGLGLFAMTICAPLAHFYFMAQSIVRDSAAATTENLQTNGTPFLIGVALLFVTYVADVIVAWALYWFFRPGQAALALLAAWARLVYSALAFVGLSASLGAYDLAMAGLASDVLNGSVLHSEVYVKISTARTIETLALCFFGVHLWVLSVLMWRSSHVPQWLSIVVAVAGASYVVAFFAKYFAPDFDMGWVLILATGELVFMLWLLLFGRRFGKQ